jgi:hypothetical protein
MALTKWRSAIPSEQLRLLRRALLHDAMQVVQPRPAEEGTGTLLCRTLYLQTVLERCCTFEPVSVTVIACVDEHFDTLRWLQKSRNCCAAPVIHLPCVATTLPWSQTLVNVVYDEMQAHMANGASRADDEKSWRQWLGEKVKEHRDHLAVHDIVVAARFLNSLAGRPAEPLFTRESKNSFMHSPV